MLLLTLLLLGPAVAAQENQNEIPSGLRGSILELFVFRTGGGLLGLRDSAAGEPGTNLDPGGHFAPSVVGNNLVLLDFLENAIGTNISDVPFSSSNSGFTVEFRDGSPVLTREAPGAIFADRAETLGAGRVSVATNVNVFNFRSLRGADLSQLQLTFTHENVDFEGCDSLAGGDCSTYGIPSFENELLQVDLDLNLSFTTLSFVMAYGLLDRVDIGVVVPVVFGSVRGSSQAQIVPFESGPAAHYFGGTPISPELVSDQRYVDGSAFGIGDVATRVKVAVTDYEPARLAFLGEARFATGSEEDLLGSGDFAFRGLGIVSSRFGPFSPHVNVGYLYNSGSLKNDAVIGTLGFDHALAPWATLAVEVLSRFQVGESRLDLPDQVVIEAPYQRIIDTQIIADIRDDIIDGSLGLKFMTATGLTVVVNSRWPLNRGGLRPVVAWTAGLEYNF